MFGYDTLGNLYKTNFILLQDHSWSMEWIDGLAPWERQVYLVMLEQKMKEEKEKKKQAEAEARSLMRKYGNT